MNLTEPQAGSDLALVRTRAEPQADGTLQALRHEDLHHLRRARHGREHRPPRARARRRRARGREGHLPVHRAEVPGQRRRLARRAQRRACASASSTSSASRRARRRCCSSATRRRRDVGYLVGEENRGLEYMFIMMNAARYAVGMQGIAVAERAYQQAVAYARERVQSRPVDGSVAGSATDHPPPRRAPHADDDARLHRRLPRDGARRRGGVRRRAPPSRRRGAQAEPGLLRVHGAAGQGLQHRDEHRGREPRRAGARRHGLHRGDRRGAVPARRADPDDLRRHDRDPGQRPGRPQDRARRRPRRPRRSPRRSRRPRRELARATSAAARVDGEAPAARRARRSSDVVDFVVGAAQGEPERGVRRLGAVPDARRQPDGRLADGARAAGRRGPLAAGEGDAGVHARPRSRPRASTPSTC